MSPTPTEASSFAVVYGLLVAAVVYRSLHLRDLWAIQVRFALTERGDRSAG